MNKPRSFEEWLAIKEDEARAQRAAQGSSHASAKAARENQRIARAAFQVWHVAKSLHARATKLLHKLSKMRARDPAIVEQAAAAMAAIDLAIIAQVTASPPGAGRTAPSSLRTVWMRWVREYFSFDDALVDQDIAAKFSSASREMFIQDKRSGQVNIGSLGYVFLEERRDGRPSALHPDEKLRNGLFHQRATAMWAAQAAAAHAALLEAVPESAMLVGKPGSASGPPPAGSASTQANVDSVLQATHTWCTAAGILVLQEWVAEDTDAAAEAARVGAEDKAQQAQAAHAAWVDRKDALRLVVPPADADATRQGSTAISTSVDRARVWGARTIHAHPTELQKCKDQLEQEGYIIPDNFRDEDGIWDEETKAAYEDALDSNMARRMRLQQQEEQQDRIQAAYDSWFTQKQRILQAARALQRIPLLSAEEAAQLKRPPLRTPGAAAEASPQGLPTAMHQELWRAVAQAVHAISLNSLEQAFLDWAHPLFTRAEAVKYWETLPSTDMMSSADRDDALSQLLALAKAAQHTGAPAGEKRLPPATPSFTRIAADEIAPVAGSFRLRGLPTNAAGWRAWGEPMAQAGRAAALGSDASSGSSSGVVTVAQAMVDAVAGKRSLLRKLKVVLCPTQLALRWEPGESGTGEASAGKPDMYLLETCGADGSSTHLSSQWQALATDPDSREEGAQPKLCKSIRGLWPNTTYHYRVRAMNSWGASGYAFGSFTTAPPVPMPPRRSGAATSSIDLSWSAGPCDVLRVRESLSHGLELAIAMGAAVHSPQGVCVAVDRTTLQRCLRADAVCRAALNAVPVEKSALAVLMAARVLQQQDADGVPVSLWDALFSSEVRYLVTAVEVAAAGGDDAAAHSSSSGSSRLASAAKQWVTAGELAFLCGTGDSLLTGPGSCSASQAAKALLAGLQAVYTTRATSEQEPLPAVTAALPPVEPGAGDAAWRTLCGAPKWACAGAKGAGGTKYAVLQRGAMVAPVVSQGGSPEPGKCSWRVHSMESATKRRVEGLQTGTCYAFAIQTINSEGIASPASAPAVVRTPLPAPRGTTVAQFPTSLRELLAWQQAAESAQGQPPATRVRVAWRPAKLPVRVAQPVRLRHADSTASLSAGLPGVGAAGDEEDDLEAASTADFTASLVSMGMSVSADPAMVAAATAALAEQGRGPGALASTLQNQRAAAVRSIMAARRAMIGQATGETSAASWSAAAGVSAAAAWTDVAGSWDVEDLSGASLPALLRAVGAGHVMKYPALWQDTLAWFRMKADEAREADSEHVLWYNARIKRVRWLAWWDRRDVVFFVVERTSGVSASGARGQSGTAAGVHGKDAVAQHIQQVMDLAQQVNAKQAVALDRLATLRHTMDDLSATAAAEAGNARLAGLASPSVASALSSFGGSATLDRGSAAEATGPGLVSSSSTAAGLQALWADPASALVTQPVVVTTEQETELPGCAPNTLYFVRLRALTHRAASASTALIPVFTPPLPPLAPALILAGPRELVLRWHAAEAGAAKFAVEAAITDVETVQELLASSGATDLETALLRADLVWATAHMGAADLATVSDLSPGTLYAVRVRSLNAAGGASEPSPMVLCATLDSGPQQHRVRALMREAKFMTAPVRRSSTVRCESAGSSLDSESDRSDSGELDAASQPVASAQSGSGRLVQLELGPLLPMASVPTPMCLDIVVGDVLVWREQVMTDGSAVLGSLAAGEQVAAAFAASAQDSVSLNTLSGTLRAAGAPPALTVRSTRRRLVTEPRHAATPAGVRWIAAQVVGETVPKAPSTGMAESASGAWAEALSMADVQAQLNGRQLQLQVLQCAGSAAAKTAAPLTAGMRVTRDYAGFEWAVAAQAGLFREVWDEEASRWTLGDEVAAAMPEPVARVLFGEDVHGSAGAGAAGGGSMAGGMSSQFPSELQPAAAVTRYSSESDGGSDAGGSAYSHDFD